MLFDEKSVAVVLGVSVRALQRWRVTGDGPPFVRVGPRFIRYEEQALATFIANGRAGSLAEERAAEAARAAESAPSEAA